MRTPKPTLFCTALLVIFVGATSNAKDKKADPKQQLVGHAKISPSDKKITAEALVTPLRLAIENRLEEMDREKYEASARRVEELVEEHKALTELLGSEKQRLEERFSKTPLIPLKDAKAALEILGRQTAVLVKKIQEAEALKEPSIYLRAELREILETAQLKMSRISELNTDGGRHPEIYRKPRLRMAFQFALLFVAPVITGVSGTQVLGPIFGGLWAFSALGTAAIGVGIFNNWSIWSGRDARNAYFKYAMPIMREAHQVFWNEVKDLLKFSNVEAWEMYVHQMSCAEALTQRTPPLGFEQISETLGVNVPTISGSQKVR